MIRHVRSTAQPPVMDAYSTGVSGTLRRKPLGPPPPPPPEAPVSTPPPPPPSAPPTATAPLTKAKAPPSSSGKKVDLSNPTPRPSQRPPTTASAQHTCTCAYGAAVTPTKQVRPYFFSPQASPQPHAMTSPLSSSLPSTPRRIIHLNSKFFRITPDKRIVRVGRNERHYSPKVTAEEELWADLIYKPTPLDDLDKSPDGFRRKRRDKRRRARCYSSSSDSDCGERRRTWKNERKIRRRYSDSNFRREGRRGSSSSGRSSKSPEKREEIAKNESKSVQTSPANEAITNAKVASSEEVQFASKSDSSVYPESPSINGALTQNNSSFTSTDSGAPDTSYQVYDGLDSETDTASECPMSQSGSFELNENNNAVPPKDNDEEEEEDENHVMVKTEAVPESRGFDEESGCYIYSFSIVTPGRKNSQPEVENEVENKGVIHCDQNSNSATANSTELDYEDLSFARKIHNEIAPVVNDCSEQSPIGNETESPEVVSAAAIGLSQIVTPKDIGQMPETSTPKERLARRRLPLGESPGADEKIDVEITSPIPHEGEDFCAIAPEAQKLTSSDAREHSVDISSVISEYSKYCVSGVSLSVRVDSDSNRDITSMDDGSVDMAGDVIPHNVSDGGDVKDHEIGDGGGTQESAELGSVMVDSTECVSGVSLSVRVDSDSDRCDITSMIDGSVSAAADDVIPQRDVSCSVTDAGLGPSGDKVHGADVMANVETDLNNEVMTSSDDSVNVMIGGVNVVINKSSEEDVVIEMDDVTADSLFVNSSLSGSQGFDVDKFDDSCVARKSRDDQRNNRLHETPKESLKETPQYAERDQENGWAKLEEIPVELLDQILSSIEHEESGANYPTNDVQQPSTSAQVPQEENSCRSVPSNIVLPLNQLSWARGWTDTETQTSIENPDPIAPRPKFKKHNTGAKSSSKIRKPRPGVDDTDALIGQIDKLITETDTLIGQKIMRLEELGADDQTLSEIAGSASSVRETVRAVANSLDPTQNKFQDRPTRTSPRRYRETARITRAEVVESEKINNFEAEGKFSPMTVSPPNEGGVSPMSIPPTNEGRLSPMKISPTENSAQSPKERVSNAKSPTAELMRNSVRELFQIVNPDMNSGECTETKAAENPTTSTETKTDTTRPEDEKSNLEETVPKSNKGKRTAAKKTMKKVTEPALIEDEDSDSDSYKSPPKSPRKSPEKTTKRSRRTRVSKTSPVKLRRPKKE